MCTVCVVSGLPLVPPHYLFLRFHFYHGINFWARGRVSSSSSKTENWITFYCSNLLELGYIFRLLLAGILTIRAVCGSNDKKSRKNIAWLGRIIYLTVNKVPDSSYSESNRLRWWRLFANTLLWLRILQILTSTWFLWVSLYIRGEDLIQPPQPYLNLSTFVCGNEE